MSAFNKQNRTGESKERASKEGGFTLIELSIVLVIIGLIVGGVLVGQDLIKAAQIRATVTQLERYNTAVNTFRGKYNGIPGDLLSGVSFFSNIAAQTASVAGQGNGDGLIQGAASSTTVCANCVAGESTVFWYELSQANMIPDAISNVAANYTYSTVNTAITSSIIPNAKVTGQISVGTANGLNYWVLAAISGTESGGVPTYANSLTPVQAFQIDTKVDDGIPSTGTIVTITTGTPGVLNDGSTAATDCGNAGTSAPTTTNDTAYNIAAQANTVNCQLSIRTNF